MKKNSEDAQLNEMAELAYQSGGTTHIVRADVQDDSDDETAETNLRPKLLNEFL